MVVKDIAEGLRIVLDDSGEVYDSILDTCHHAKIDPETLMDILDGKRRRFNDMRFYCIDEHGRRVPARYRLVYITNGPKLGRRRNADTVDVGIWIGLTNAEFEQAIEDCRRTDESFANYVNRRLKLR